VVHGAAERTGLPTDIVTATLQPYYKASSAKFRAVPPYHKIKGDEIRILAAAFLHAIDG